MRILIQRVKKADVSVDGKEASNIGYGLLLFVGVGSDDTPEDIEQLAKKVINLRIFEDDEGRMNLNIKQVNGEILSVSQFTLYADTNKGNRPGFTLSADPENAKRYWKKLNDLMKKERVAVHEGIFGTHMEVSLVNDGPVTIWLDSKKTT